jgi:integrase
MRPFALVGRFSGEAMAAEAADHRHDLAGHVYVPVPSAAPTPSRFSANPSAAPSRLRKPAGCSPTWRCCRGLTLLGTGLRFGELAGLRRRRVHLDRPLPVLQVVEVRYQAGRKYGSGFKPRPKSDAGIRELPLAPQVAEAIGRQLPPGTDPTDLVFTGPGGGPGAKRGTRTVLSRDNFRRMYRGAVARAGGDLAHLDLHGAHDLRHSFSTWLEDAGIPPASSMS